MRLEGELPTFAISPPVKEIHISLFLLSFYQQIFDVIIFFDISCQKIGMMNHKQKMSKRKTNICWSVNIYIRNKIRIRITLQTFRTPGNKQINAINQNKDSHPVN